MSIDRAVLDKAYQAMCFVYDKRAYAERRLKNCPLERFLQQRVSRSGSRNFYCPCRCHLGKARWRFR